MVSTVASQQEGSRFKPVAFACSLQAPGVLLKSRDMQVRLTGGSKLPVGVNVSVNGCLSLCVSPVTAWRPVQGGPHLSPKLGLVPAGL